MLHARNGTLQMDGTQMDYIVFGRGERTLVMIPGLGDGLKSVRGLAIPFAVMYRKFAKTHRVYMFSRKRVVPRGITSRDMARDLKRAMDMLGIKQADIFGVSQGGTIAQWLAVDHPQAVRKLVLVVTYPRENPVLNTAIPRWMEYAKAGDHRGLMIDTAEYSYSEAYLKKFRRLYPLITRVGAPKSYEKFLNMGDACLTHNAYEAVSSISCPTLIVGGEQDQIVGAVGSYELAEQIQGSQLYMYPEYGHGLYEEAKDFIDRVIAFLNT